MIYKLILPNNDPVYLYASDRQPEPEHWRAPALLHRRQIKAEAAGIYYSKNTFDVNSVDLDETSRRPGAVPPPAKWLLGLDLSSRALIRKIRLDDMHYEDDEVEMWIERCRDFLRMRGLVLVDANIYVELHPRREERWACA